MLWSALPFGKYKGKSLPQVVLEDPDYFFWADETNVFKGSYVLQAEVIYSRARRIKPPLIDGELPIVEYLIHQPTGKSLGFKLLKTSDESDYPAPKMTVIDLMVPRNLNGYDKLGYRIFLRSLKFQLFGKEDLKLTRKHCEAFFNDDSNFLLQNDGLAVQESVPCTPIIVPNIFAVF